MERKHLWFLIVTSLVLCFMTAPVYAQNQILGEVAFSAATKVEKTSGVWIDGQYVGYLKELRGPKKVMLLPGNHEISVRQSGYTNFIQNITVEPGQVQIVRVAMQKDRTASWPTVTSTLKLDVQPDRAAVFLDDAFVGHAAEFGGAFHSMLMSPGKHRIKIELPGYQTFETEVNLLVGQKSEVKTDLVRGSIEQAGPLIKSPKVESAQPDQ
jgi:PEGA domain